MSDESTGFSQAKARLEEIVSQVRKKDTSLEKSLDLLEEGVRLANRCTELIDQADWDAAAAGGDETEADDADTGGDDQAVPEAAHTPQQAESDSADGEEDATQG